MYQRRTKVLPRRASQTVPRSEAKSSPRPERCWIAPTDEPSWLNHTRSPLWKCDSSMYARCLWLFVSFELSRWGDK